MLVCLLILILRTLCGKSGEGFFSLEVLLKLLGEV